MDNPFKVLSDFFNDIAVVAADLDGEITSLESKIDDYNNEIKEVTNGMIHTNPLPSQVTEVIEVLKRANEYTADKLNDIRVQLKKMVASVNAPEVFRDAFKDIILTFSTLPNNYKIDESTINLSPSETGIHFAEYVYDANTRKLTANLDTDLSHYSVEGIVNTYVPNIITYYESALKIISIVASRVLEEMEGRIKDLYKGVATINDPAEGTVKEAHRWYENATIRLYDSISDIRSCYQIAANMVKNIGIIESAFTHYTNSKNRVMTL